jgi:hypothetical protein
VKALQTGVCYVCNQPVALHGCVYDVAGARHANCTPRVRPPLKEFKLFPPKRLGEDPVVDGD